MAGERELDNLLRHMKPVIEQGEYVFCTVQEDQLVDIEDPIMIFGEREGITVIVTKDIAERNGLEFSSTWGLITLSIHSSLEAVGFLAAVTYHLARAKIGVNAVSAFYHDHLFVPYEKRREAYSLLTSLSESLK